MSQSVVGASSGGVEGIQQRPEPGRQFLHIAEAGGNFGARFRQHAVEIVQRLRSPWAELRQPCDRSSFNDPAMFARLRSLSRSLARDSVTCRPSRFWFSFLQRQLHIGHHGLRGVSQLRQAEGLRR